jgi:hypothetical protein
MHTSNTPQTMDNVQHNQGVLNWPLWEIFRESMQSFLCPVTTIYSTLHLVIMAVERADKISHISGRFQFQSNTTVSNTQSTLRQPKAIAITWELHYAIRLYNTLTIIPGLTLGICSWKWERYAQPNQYISYKNTFLKLWFITIIQ